MTNGSPFDYQQIFHTGIRVPNLDEAMAEIGDPMAVTWASPVTNPAQAIWTPEAGEHTLELRFTYSCEGPQHIELLEGPEGSVWSGHAVPGLHHQGVWASDVAEQVHRLETLGWRCVAAGQAPENGYGGFAYLQPPSGLIIELVTDAVQPRFEQWWGGGSLG